MVQISIDTTTLPGGADALHGVTHQPFVRTLHFAGPGDAMKPDTDDELGDEDEDDEDDDEEFDDDDELADDDEEEDEDTEGA